MLRSDTEICSRLTRSPDIKKIVPIIFILLDINILIQNVFNIFTSLFSRFSAFFIVYYFRCGEGECFIFHLPSKRRFHFPLSIALKFHYIAYNVFQWGKEKKKREQIEFLRLVSFHRLLIS